MAEKKRGDDEKDEERGGKRRGGKRENKHGKGRGGGDGKKKAKRKAKKLEKKERRALKRDATAAANVRYAEELRGVESEIGRGQAHQAALAQGYQMFQDRLQELGQAQRSAVENAIGSRAAVEQGLQKAAGQFSGELAQQAGVTSEMLGQSGVGQQKAMLTGAGAGQANANQAMLETGAMSDIGLANVADFQRRSAIAGQDELAAQQNAENYIREQIGNKLGLQGDRGAYITQMMQQMKGEAADREIAEMGLQMDQKTLAANVADDRADNREARKSRKQDRREAAKERQHESSESAKDRAEDRWEAKHGGSSGGGSGGGGGGGKGGGPSNKLSPSEQEERKEVYQDLDTAIDAYTGARRRGLSAKQAANKARKQTGAERWEIKVAKDLSDSKLSRKGRTLIKSKVPGGGISKRYR